MNIQSAYGNIPIFSPDGIMMFNANERRLKFYLKNNLIEPFDKGYKLTFTPNGLGYNGKDSTKRLLYPRENQCVVCGDKDISLLTRHHIVPILFRKWMPDEIKSKNFQYVVLIRYDLHSKYTVEEHKYYKIIAELFNVKGFEDTLFIHASEIVKKRKCANTLFKYSHLIPEDKLKVLKSKFTSLTNLSANFENYKKVCEEIKETEKRYYKNADYNFGKLVIEQVKNYKEFEKLWLDHFIKTMSPKFLPLDLQVLL